MPQTLIFLSLYIFKLQPNVSFRAVNNSLFKAHSDPIFFRPELLNLDDTYKIGVLSFVYKYFYENLPTSFHDRFNYLAEPKRTKSYKLERVLFKTLECFPSALFPKLWNSIELERKETKKLNLQNCLKEKSSKTL